LASSEVTFDHIDLASDNRSQSTIRVSRYDSRSSRIISKFSRDWTNNIHNSRPELGTIIRDFFAEATGAACVLACGPPAMMDSIRESVVDYLDLNDRGRVDYFEEAFLW
jgi:NAD(P)H-flavin reductase